MLIIDCSWIFDIMQQIKKIPNKKRPSRFHGGDISLDDILKLNRFDNEFDGSQPSTPLVPSSSKSIMPIERKGPRSLIGSPVPCRLKNGLHTQSNICSPVSKRKIPVKTKVKTHEKENVECETDLKTTGSETNQLRLEKVFGFTIQNNASVALDPTSGIIAFPAGCVVIGYSPKRSKQFFIHNSVKSPITALAFSRDGKLLATGESGKAPKVRIWNVETRSQIAEFSGHNYRVGALTFSPNSRFVVSVGSQEDMTINVWEMSSNLKIASSRVTSKVNAVTFSESGQFFVTVGVRHVRFWYLDNNRSKSKTTIALSGRNAILGNFFNNTFNDVGCCCLNSNSGVGQMTSSMCSSISSSNSQSYTYVISQAGQLMQFTEQRYLDKWVELQTPKATCLTVCESYIMVGCSRGIILMFDTASLSHLATLPKPHFLGINLQMGDHDNRDKHDPVRYPDIIAGKYDHIHSRITYFYNDHSLYVWDVRDIRNPVKVGSHLFHSGGVWSVEPVPLPQNEAKGLLDASSFITCSDDETIRFWHLLDSHSKLNHSQNEKVPSVWRNDYSKELLKIIYTDPQLKCLTESDRFLVKNNHQSNEANVALKHGIRSIKISPDRQQLATADREGNLRFYSLVDYKELYSIIAHNGEILSIDYFQSPSAPDLILFCSASRDRIIHVMDPCQEYKCIQTIDDHSGAIFSVKLVETPSDQEIRLLSCGMDKSLLFRILQPDESGQTAQFFLNQHLVGKQSQYDMVIAPNNRYAAVACQDRQVRIYNLVTGKQRKSYRGSISDDGNLLRCAIDPSGTYLATSGSDKCLHILNFTTGEILASITGHSEMALGICFLYDLKHLVSVSSDNCIFVWRLPVEMTLNMHRRMKELGSPNYANFADGDIKRDTAPPSTCGTVTPPRMSDDTNLESSTMSTPNIGESAEIGSPSTFRFSVSALPSWAQKKFSRRDSITFVQVNMMNEFCAGMSTVVERSEENQFFNDNISKDDMTSRRLSFIATEKIVRNDDSDNFEEEDSEWFGAEKNNFERSIDLDSIIQRASTGDEDDDDEEEDCIMTKNPPLRSASLEDYDYDRQHCAYIIKSNNESLKKDDDNYIMSTSAPSTLANWMDEKGDYSSAEDPQAIENDFSINGSHLSCDESLALEETIINGPIQRGSLTTRSTIVNFQYKNDSDKNDRTNDKSFQRPTETSARKINAPIPSLIIKKPISTKCRSEINVSQVGAVRKKSEPCGKALTKVNFSHGKHVEDRSESRDRKEGDKKPRFNSSAERRAISKSISTASVANIDQCAEPRARAATFIQNPKRSIESKPIISKLPSESSGKPNRPKWGDNRRTRDLRKTCPVDLKEIKAASTRHSNNLKVPNDIDISTTNEPHNTQTISDLSKNELQIQPTKENDEDNKPKSTFQKGASFDLLSGQGKEHVIDEIEEIAGHPHSRSYTPHPSGFEEMLKYLATQTQAETKESTSGPLISSLNKRMQSSGGECELVKSLDLEETELCTNEWIDDLCGSHDLDFLTTMTPKILRRLVNNPDLNNESQRQVATRLLTEIEQICEQFRSNLDLPPISRDTDNTASLIRDIGERIVDEVKKKLSESL